MTKKRFFTLFPQAENVHLSKDVGMIPFMMHKTANFEAAIACYGKGDYPYLDNEVKGLNLVFIKRLFNNELLDGLWFLLLNSRKIDVLIAFHYLSHSILWLTFFKIITLGRGKTYLKLDADLRFQDINVDRINEKVKLFLLRKMDLVSTETKQMVAGLGRKWKVDIKLVPNGFFDDFSRTDVEWREKENIILTVGTIGLPRKWNELLLDAFKSLSRENSDWKLMLVGPIVEPGFHDFVEDYFNQNPELRQKVEITGNISDRRQLLAIYEKSKIFALTSKAEGFPLVYLDALKSGCFIITSNVTAAEDITDGGSIGKVFPVGDVNNLTLLLKNAIRNEEEMKAKIVAIQNFAYENFYWPKIVKKIDTFIYGS